MPVDSPVFRRLELKTGATGTERFPKKTHGIALTNGPIDDIGAADVHIPGVGVQDRYGVAIRHCGQDVPAERQ